MRDRSGRGRCASSSCVRRIWASGIVDCKIRSSLRQIGWCHTVCTGDSRMFLAWLSCFGLVMVEVMALCICLFPTNLDRCTQVIGDNNKKILVPVSSNSNNIYTPKGPVIKVNLWGRRLFLKNYFGMMPMWRCGRAPAVSLHPGRGYVGPGCHFRRRQKPPQCAIPPPPPATPYNALISSTSMSVKVHRNSVLFYFPPEIGEIYEVWSVVVAGLPYLLTRSRSQRVGSQRAASNDQTCY